MSKLLHALAALALMSASTDAAPSDATRIENRRGVPDDLGDIVPLADAPCRIVSLSPGTTAMLFAAGAGHCLVGTIAHSDEPKAAASIPVIGDAENLDFEKLLALRPTAVVAAVDVVQRVRIDRIRALGMPVYRVHVTSLAGMPESVARLGALAGDAAVANGAQAAARDLRAALDALRARYASRAPIRVLYQIWDRPIYTIGGRHVISDALSLCGAVNIFAELATAAPAVTREAVVLRNPDLILASAPPGAAEEWLAEWRKLPALAAVRARQLVSYNDARIDRMGPSVIDATGDLCEVIDRARSTRP